MRILMMSLLLVAIVSTAWGVELVDRVVAVVDEDPILASEVEAYAQFVIQQGRRTLSDEELEQLKGQVLQELIDRRVLLYQARLDTVEIEDREVEAELETRLAQEIEQLGSAERMEEIYGRPLRQLKRDLRDRIREGMMIDRLKWQKQQEIEANRSDVEAFWAVYQDSLPELEEAVKIRHILREPQVTRDARQVALDRATMLHQRLTEGTDFEQLAMDASDDPGTAANGGDLGETVRGDLVPGYEEVAYQLEEGEISELVETDFGFHIIRLDWRHGERIHSHHILVRLKTEEKDESAALAFLDSLKGRISDEDESFLELATQYSDDEDSAPSGGMMGWYEVANMPQEFRQAVRGLDVGEVSLPFLSDYGAHIIQVDELQEKRAMSLEADWDRIETMALNQKRERVFQNWVVQLRKRVYIDTNLPAEETP